MSAKIVPLRQNAFEITGLAEAWRQLETAQTEREEAIGKIDPNTPGATFRRRELIEAMDADSAAQYTLIQECVRQRTADPAEILAKLQLFRDYYAAAIPGLSEMLDGPEDLLGSAIRDLQILAA
jgi:hypothetical protein